MKCRCKPYGKSLGMCRLDRPRYKHGDLVEQLWTDGTWRGPFDVVREWRRKGWGREHMVLLSMWTMTGDALADQWKLAKCDRFDRQPLGGCPSQAAGVVGTLTINQPSPRAHIKEAHDQA